MVRSLDWVMVFDPKDSQEETETQFRKYLKNNYSAVGDKAVPNKLETLKMLHGK